MKKLMIVAVVGLGLFPFISSAHTACQAGDLFNTDTGARCVTISVPTPCRGGELYDTQTGKLCSIESIAIASTPTSKILDSVASNEIEQQNISAPAILKQQQLDAINLQIANLNLKLANDIETIQNKIGETVNTKISEISVTRNQYYLDLTKLQAQYQVIELTN